MRWFIVTLVLLFPWFLSADDFDNAEEMSVTKAKLFIKEYPIVVHKVDEIGLINIWQRIQGLQNLISIWESNREVFEQEGPHELSLSQIRQRIWSHKVHARYEGNDELVKALVDIIQLHATIADRYMNDEINYIPYADIAGYTILSGRYFAKNIWIKYGKCLRKKNPGKKKTEDKLFM